ncbi:hypothetical protein HWV00_04440 [Moritella sp. 24]|uniref:hypothetical protein n=1 Tax=Moritella sp. 24 TaxID=2746230 RepID=UPI001BA4F891|nr:hypothetical protein [Moritella sp. 24]QUM75542.1 hypothetical protein HWV00_04440 [Moritella sp. 24]
MMPKSINNDVTGKLLKVNQANAFYNYVLGFDSANIDLLQTGSRFLKEGVSTSVFFSDFKCMYIDESGNKKIEVISRTGRDFDSNWKLEFSDEMPKSVATELLHSCEIAFHENRIQNEEVPYLRVCLPPILLDNEEYQLPLFTSIKIYSDGIAILSFQLDATWDGLDESHFLSDIVNMYNYYFKSIWIDSRLQKLDAKVVLNNAYEEKFSIGGKYLTNWKIKQLIKKSKQDTQKFLDEALKVEGHYFDFGDGGGNCTLHQIVGTENSESEELTVDLCRSIYCNAISRLLVSEKNERKTSLGHFMWQGRPSITLLRFEDQPENKEELYKSFSHSISKILLRANNVAKNPNLPPDLRVFDDFCLHGNRSILLWTWLKSENSSENVWDDINTASTIFGNQARTELIEYYNLKVARACTWAQNPRSNDHLLYAYKILASSDSMIHQSSCSGEIVDSLSYLMEIFGTTGLINSGKESARYHLDELRYNADKAKSRSDSSLALIFGLVGAASLAQFVVHPFVKETWPLLSEIQGPVVSFGMSGGGIILLATLIRLINDR